MNNEILRGDEVHGSNSGTLYGFGTDMVWDSRDNIFFPNTGGYQYMKFLIYPSFSEHVFGFIEVDVKHFHAFSEDHVFVCNVYVAHTFGETPFYMMPAIGGPSRGRG